VSLKWIFCCYENGHFTELSNERLFNILSTGIAKGKTNIGIIVGPILAMVVMTAIVIFIYKRRLQKQNRGITASCFHLFCFVPEVKDIKLDLIFEKNDLKGD
jgi:hypothetical protein